MISHEKEWGRFSLPYSESKKKVTENYHQKILLGVVVARRLGLWYASWNYLNALVIARKFSCWGWAP